jgi:molybdopterin-guanine dinucleotide biosynthesis adapter protein
VTVEPAAATRDPAAVPLICFVGRSGSGKTTLLEGLIRALSRRGLSVGVVKHHAHDVELDVPKKDSWRLAQAGATATAVSGPLQFALIRRVAEEPTLAELVELMPDADIVLTEGFKAQVETCVEVLRSERSSEPVCGVSQLIALATDVPTECLPATYAAAVAAGTLRMFDLNDVDAIAQAIVTGTLSCRAQDQKARPSTTP